MLGRSGLCASTVIHLTELGLRPDAENMPQLDHVGRDTGNHVGPVERKTLFPVKVDEIPFHSNPQRGIQ